MPGEIQLTPNAQPKRSRGRPPLSSEDISARREKVTQIAFELFIAKGFAATTLDEIAGAAGMTKRAIYNLVGDKQALFQAACNISRAGGPGFKFDIILAGRSTLDVLQQMAHQLIEHALDPELVLLERTVVQEAGHDERIVKDIVTESSGHLFRVIARCFDAMVEAGLLKPFDTLTAAAIFYDATVGSRGFRAVLGMEPERPQKVDIMTRVRMFLHGYVEQNLL